MSSSPSTLVVSPTFNERMNLRELVSRFFAAAPDCHLLIVDDDSPDGTAAFCRELQQEFPRLHLLERREERGLGRAYLAGLRYGMDQGFDVIGTMDADLSHDPDHLPAMRILAETHDVVVGSRYIRDGGTINWTIRRIMLSWLANRFAAFVLRMPAHDVTSGFRLYRRRALSRIHFEDLNATGYSFLFELLYRLHRQGCTIAESPIVFCDRTLGVSKLGTREIYVGAWRLIQLPFKMRRRRETTGSATQTSSAAADNANPAFRNRGS
jgi:dolichol-phosphate mannosyltransferase